MTADSYVTVAPQPQRTGRHGRAFGDVSAGVVGIVGGLAVGAGLAATRDTWSGPGGLMTSLGTMSALAGTYLCLVALMLAARMPWLEREVGQDRLVAWHRKVGPWALVLVTAHFALTSLGYAQAADVSIWDEVVTLITSYPWMMPAAAAMGIMVLLGIVSVPSVRQRMAYETWWAGHLYFYLAIALAFGHQLTSGSLFSSHDVLRYLWVALYITFAATIVWSRLALPVVTSVRHDLRVDRVVREADGLISIYLSGRNLAQLNARGGQFFAWRFLTRNWWWQAHPYSLSAGANGSWLRITVKDLGDQSGALAQLRPGTRVIAEGPYGVFTAESRETSRIAAFAAGIGITPIRAMLDDLPPGVKVTVVYRVAEVQDETVALRAELEEIVSRRGWELIYLPGSRNEYAMSVDYLTQLVPTMALSDVYVCGPRGFADAVRAAACTAGVPPSRLHHEAFAF